MMVSAKTLIEINNRKRKLLTEENEKYYSDLLIYIRSNMSVSERATEEILLEILEHLLEGQREGKTAEEIFGKNPKEYADEILGLLPKEKLTGWISFIAVVAADLLGIVLMISGLILFIVSQFREVDPEIFLIKELVVFLVNLSMSLALAAVVFRFIKKSVYLQNAKAEKKFSLEIFFIVGTGGALMIAFTAFFPDFGPSVTVSWPVQILAGFVIWASVRVAKKIFANK